MIRKLQWLLLALLMLLTPGCAQADELAAIQDLAAMMAAYPDALYVDLRSEKDFNKLHIPGFVNLEYDEDAVLSLRQAPGPICLICLSGVRSAKVYELLHDAGRTDVYVCTFGVADYAAEMGEEQLEGAEICVPCILLEKSLADDEQEDEMEETAWEADEITTQETGEEET